MRLICPNCDAQYEVDASLIPEMGRDVQCSDCGHVWFQPPEGAAEADLALDDDIAAVVTPTVPAAPAPPTRPAAARAAAARPAPEPEPDPAPAAEEPDPQVLRRHTLDESLLAVLREEAERETRARAEEAARAAGRGLEMQPELGLGDPAPALRIRPRATPATAPEPEEAVAPAPGGAPPAPARPARRELLPDIDRINSTLDASNATRHGAPGRALPDTPERQRSGFRRGFLLVLVLGGLGWTAYAQSEQLGEAWPQLRPVLDGFVAVVDKARLALDGLVRGLLGTLQG